MVHFNGVIEVSRNRDHKLIWKDIFTLKAKIFTVATQLKVLAQLLS